MNVKPENLLGLPRKAKSYKYTQANGIREPREILFCPILHLSLAEANLAENSIPSSGCDSGWECHRYPHNARSYIMCRVPKRKRTISALGRPLGSHPECPGRRSERFPRPDEHPKTPLYLKPRRRLRQGLKLRVEGTVHQLCVLRSQVR